MFLFSYGSILLLSWNHFVFKMCKSIANEVQICPFLGHLLRDDLINPVKMSVRPYVRTSVSTYVRPYVCTSTIKHNAATNQIVEFVRVDETFTMIWLSRSSEVRVKVTWDLKFQKWRFSKSISSVIFKPIKNIPTVSETRPKYLKSLKPDFWISS